MLVPSDPIVLILLAIVLGAFWLASSLRDTMTARREGPLRDTMPSLVPGGAVELPIPQRRLHCGLCGGAHDYDDCPLNSDDAA